MKSVRLPVSNCLNIRCGMPNDAASHRGRATPRPNDYTVCFYCGHVMAFAEDLTMRALTGKEMIDTAGDQRIIAIQHAIRLRRRLL